MTREAQRQEGIEKHLNYPRKASERAELGNGISVRNMTLRADRQDFDVLQAEKTIRLFILFLQDVLSRYTENERIKEKAEAQEQDLSHAISLLNGLTEKEKRLIFRRMIEALKTRRQCKNENEVLKPLYDYISDKELLNRLGIILGNIRKSKEVIDNRSYGCRTAILDDFREETSVTDGKRE